MNANKSSVAKIIKISLSAVSAFALAISTVHAGAANQVSPSTNGFSIQDSTTFGLPAGPVTSGPVQRNIRPVYLTRAAAVPDSGSTAVFLALSLFGLSLMGRKFVRN